MAMRTTPEILLRELVANNPNFAFRMDFVPDEPHCFRMSVFGVPLSKHRSLSREIIMISGDAEFSLIPIIRDFEMTAEFFPDIAREIISRRTVADADLCEYMHIP